MERRKLLIGLGSLAAGSAAATGTGAFSAMSATRDANISVVTDDSGLIALTDETTGDVVRQTNDGELAIDFSGRNGNAGVNVDSVYQVGRFIQYPPFNTGRDPSITEFNRQVYNNAFATPVYEEPAFMITNNANTEKQVTLSYTPDSFVSGSLIYFQIQDEDDGTPPTVGSGNTNGELTADISVDDASEHSATITLSSGESAGVSFAVTTVGTNQPGDLSGDLVVSATDSN